MQVNKRAYSKLPPIANIDSLASMLSISKEKLIKISNDIDNQWKPGKLLTKKNGDPRQTIDAKPALKEIHEKIKNRLLKQVVYPKYLFGGIEDKMSPRDYKRHAEMHTVSSIIFNEDIKDFFPSSSKEVIFGIWKHLFHCTDEIAELLTKLTTLKGSLPQGWKTSGYLANLVFWDKEHELVKKLSNSGFSYSRFMDDITISSKTKISKANKTSIINEIYRMLNSKGYAPKRSKHEIHTNKDKMEVIGLTVNSSKSSLPRAEQNNIRAIVHKCECHAQNERSSYEYKTLWNSASGKVGKLTRFHIGKGAQLRKKLRAVKPIMSLR